MKTRILLIAFALAAAPAWAERVTCPASADTWVEAPSWEGARQSPATDNHGADPTLVINGRRDFALLDFDLSAARGMKVSRAYVRVYQDPKIVPLTVVGLSTISGAGAWKESAANYFFAQAGQSWAYPGSDLTDVSFGPGGSLYTYRKARAAGDGWFEIEVPPALVSALATGDQFGWMLTDEKGQTRTRHVLGSRESDHPPVLIVEGERTDRTPPGRARSLKTGGGVLESSIAEARSLGRTTLEPGSAILHFGGAGSDTARYELRYSRQPVQEANFSSAAPVARWTIDPLAPKPSPLATENALRDEVWAIAEGLDPGGVYYFAARATDGAGNHGPVSALGRYRAFARTFPQLPARAAGSGASAGNGGPEANGPVRIWAVPELFKIDPKTGAVLELKETPEYRARNAVWNAAESKVRLAGARNEFVAFQLAVESQEPLRGIDISVAEPLFRESTLPAVFRTTGAVQLYREWFVPDDKDTGPGRPWYPDPLVPLNGPLDLPAADNAVPGQTVQPFFADIYIPHDAAPGVHRGAIQVRAGNGFRGKVTVEVEVLPLRLPDELNFVVDLNAYSGVNSGWGEMRRGTPEYRKLLREYHRVAQLNRANLDILGYSHSGSVEPDQTPPLAGEGAATKVVSWADFDAHFGPLLDGSAFADLPRGSVPVTNIYLALFENWPGDLRKSYRHNNYPLPRTTEEYWALIARHGLEAGPIEESFPQDYQDRYSAVARQFAEHFRERGWLRTNYQVYFNDKYFYKDPARSPGARGVSWWLMDEPNHRDDYRAISFFAYLTKRWLKDYPDVPITLRTDISYIDYIRDLLAGQIDVDTTSQHLFTKNRYALDHRDRFGKVYWNYASTNHPRDTNVAMRAWCWRAWVAGADAVVPWNTIRGIEAWDRAEPLTVFYVGKKLGSDAPFASLRLKAFRRGQQDVEYLTLLARKRGWDREAVSRAVSGAADLSTGIRKQSEEDAGVLRFQRARDGELDQLRLRVAAALEK